VDASFSKREIDSRVGPGIFKTVAASAVRRASVWRLFSFSKMGKPKPAHTAPTPSDRTTQSCDLRGEISKESWKRAASPEIVGGGDDFGTNNRLVLFTPILNANGQQPNTTTSRKDALDLNNASICSIIIT
jgi:hypothetical protein